MKVCERDSGGGEKCEDTLYMPAWKTNDDKVK
jgi:hypothetical protein